MNKSILKFVVSVAILATIQTSTASEVTGLTSFTANTPAVAAQVNGNFTAVKTAVDNNHARITTLEGNAANPNINISGNITLVPSTSTGTAGNIMKGTVPFLHDFGTNNTFLGEGAGNFTMSVGGANNTASGRYALQSIMNGHSNTASGANALQFNNTGFSNTASGANALQSNTSGPGNTASGANALQSNINGNSNTASGWRALTSNTTGVQNTASGDSALTSNTTGNDNIVIGYGAGRYLTTGNYNIAIGHVGDVGESNTTRIGMNQTRAFIAGIFGVTTTITGTIPVLISAAGQLGTASSSRRVKDDIADMGKASNVLMQLRPVTFHYKTDQNPNGRSLQYGLVAEEVEKVAPGLVARSANGEIETVFYQHLAPMLVNEYQKQQRTIEKQAALLGAQTAELAKQTARVAQLEQQAHELAGLKAQMAHVTAVLSRLQLPERIAAAK